MTNEVYTASELRSRIKTNDEIVRNDGERANYLEGHAEQLREQAKRARKELEALAAREEEEAERLRANVDKAIRRAEELRERLEAIENKPENKTIEQRIEALEALIKGD